jgi:hypothetical protein
VQDKNIGKLNGKKESHFAYEDNERVY